MKINAPSRVDSDAYTLTVSVEGGHTYTHTFHVMVQGRSLCVVTNSQNPKFHNQKAGPVLSNIWIVVSTGFPSPSK